jgi:glycosyltransferase involved in cell wall biosynthesis
MLGYKESSRASMSDCASPILSIITPTLNSAKTIKDTLESANAAADALSRKGFAVEHLVIDGGSDDITDEIVAAHQSQVINDRRSSGYQCSFYRTKNAGAYAAMNEGLNISTGKYAHILNADDYILNPERYSTEVEKLASGDNLILLSSIIYFRRPSHRKEAEWRLSEMPSSSIEWKRDLLSGLHYPHPGFVARTDIYRDEQFDLRYKYSADYKLMQSLLLKEKCHDRIRICSEPLIAMAKGGLTGTWHGIVGGAGEIRAINRELGIDGSLLRRYAGKIAMRLMG